MKDQFLNLRLLCSIFLLSLCFLFCFLFVFFFVCLFFCFLCEYLNQPVWAYRINTCRVSSFLSQGAATACNATTAQPMTGLNAQLANALLGTPALVLVDV